MKLHSPEFERKLRRSVKTTIRRSPELKREARRTNRARHYSARPLFRLAFSGVTAGLTWIIAQKTGYQKPALVFIGIWLLGWISALVQSLAHQLYASSDLPALSLLPIEPRVILRQQLEKFVLNTTWLLVDLLAMLGALALFAEIPFWQCLAIIPIAILGWLTTLALVGLAIVYLPWLPYPLITAAITLSPFVFLVTRAFIGPALLAGLNASANTLQLILPTAWPMSLFRLLSPNPSWFELLFLVPSIALIFTLRQTYVRIAAGYQFSETIQPESSDIIPDEESAITTVDPDAPTRVGLTAIEEFIQTRGFLATAPWSKEGWLETRLWQWMSSQERKLAEFVFPNAVQMTKTWKKAFQHLSIGLAIGFTLRWVNTGLSFWVTGGAMLLPALRVAACFYGNGRAFHPMFCSGVNIQLYAVYPIGYRGLSRVLFKYSFVQLPLIASFLIICGLVMAYLFGWPFPLAALNGFKAAFFLAALRLIFVVFAFSSGTNDSSRLRSDTFLMIVMFLTLGSIFLGLAIAGLFVPQPILSLGFCAGAMVVAWLFWRAYGFFYDANRFDIMNLPKQQL